MNCVKWFSGAWIRPGNNGYHDAGTLTEVFHNDCHAIRSIDFTPNTILDIGANIGAFSLLAHQLWPNARIAAVEPNPTLHHVLNLNIEPFAIVFPFAITNSKSPAITPTEPSAAVKVSNTGQIPVQPATINQILDYANFDHCDLAKLDCEGCEYDALSHSLDRFNYLIVEYHNGPIKLDHNWTTKQISGNNKVGIIHAKRN